MNSGAEKYNIFFFFSLKKTEGETAAEKRGDKISKMADKKRERSHVAINESGAMLGEKSEW